MTVKHIIPNKNEFGGIQQFALSIISTQGQSSVEVIDWKVSKNIFIRFTQIAQAFVKYVHYGNKSDINTIEHHWCVDSAVGMKRRSKTIITCHGNEILKSYKTIYRYPLIKQALRRCSLIHANSNFTKNYLIHEYGVSAEKILVINPPVDINSIKYHKKTKRVYKVPTIGSLTRLVKRKNISTLIDALNILNRKGIDFHYVLAGDGPERQNILKKIKSSGIPYSYIGKIDDDTKYNSFYPSLDIFALAPLYLPADVEGFGMVFLEANAAGTPVIAAKTGGISDAVKPGYSGYYADPHNASNIAEQIELLLLKSQDIRPDSRKWAINFSSAVIGESFKKMYERL